MILQVPTPSLQLDAAPVDMILIYIACMRGGFIQNETYCKSSLVDKFNSSASAAIIYASASDSVLKKRKVSFF
jgi:hypothetical protein